LTAERRRVIPALQKRVASQLAQLGFRRSQFEISLSPAETSAMEEGPPPLASGYEQVEFLFAPNPGEPSLPLRAIASSGELARVMLALKTVLAAQDAVPVLVFDEVDANIGGDTAQSVGLKMRDIGGHRQVLCITHLAPVAACASAHFSVTKETGQERTTTRITRLDQANRVDELGRMLGGPRDAARRHAEVLLHHAQNGAVDSTFQQP
jgi:DNA repair protein RecN (Recombination protein N)